MESTRTDGVFLAPKSINPYFGSKLPEILEEISKTIIATESHLDKVKIRVQELHDFLQFEITKARVEITKNCLADQTDPEKLSDDEEWLKRLEYIVSEFEAGHTLSSVNFLQALQKELRETLLGYEAS
jgi:hypothetical protein